MTGLKTIGSELWGLFVDDGLLAIMTLAWLALIGLSLRYADAANAAGWAGLSLFAGLALILVTSVGRAARERAAARRSDD